MCEIDDFDAHFGGVFDSAFLIESINFILCRAVIEEQQ